MGSSLDEYYSVTRVATAVACYITFMMLSRGGASGMSDGGILEWVLGWVCVRGFIGCEFLNVVQLGYYDGILLRRLLGMSLSLINGVLWEILDWTLAGLCGRMFGVKFCGGPWLGNLDGWLVRNFRLEPGWGIRK